MAVDFDAWYVPAVRNGCLPDQAVYARAKSQRFDRYATTLRLSCLDGWRTRMADRVGFMLGGSDGVLSHFLGQPLQDFHVWYHEALQESPDEFEFARWHLLGRILLQGPSAVHSASPTDVNLLILDYYGSYANIHGLNQGLHHYWSKLVDHQLLVDALRQQEPSPMVELLTRTVMGRLAIPDPSFPLNDWRDYELSYWTAHEVVTLREAMGDLTQATVLALREDEMLFHAVKTTREALDIAATHSTGLIIFVGW